MFCHSIFLQACPFLYDFNNGANWDAKCQSLFSCTSKKTTAIFKKATTILFLFISAFHNSFLYVQPSVTCLSGFGGEGGIPLPFNHWTLFLISLVSQSFSSSRFNTNRTASVLCMGFFLLVSHPLCSLLPWSDEVCLPFTLGEGKKCVENASLFQIQKPVPLSGLGHREKMFGGFSHLSRASKHALV